ncbi:MAG: 2-C-methyl-D-erythritol 2,4-cyclodiphosphate synthase [Dehalococcoidales bacterium]|nr:2-C-methyl-D-erythritol 2,4-cyclodiphosphate synthase [Dehalococcoidales bacterium]
MRVGIGYDTHPLVPDRLLVLGGITLPFARGLEGWSDADVLTHAIIEALLGAAALGDIGRHFPAGDPQYKDISSLIMLDKVKDMLAKHSWQIGNIDATIVTEEPKLKDHIEAIRQLLSKTLGITLEQISLKASTNNGLGAIGRGEGIAAYAVALIEDLK